MSTIVYEHSMSIFSATLNADEPVRVACEHASWTIAFWPTPGPMRNIALSKLGAIRIYGSVELHVIGEGASVLENFEGFIVYDEKQNAVQYERWSEMTTVHAPNPQPHAPALAGEQPLS